MVSVFHLSAHDASLPCVLSSVESRIAHEYLQRVHEFHIAMMNDGLDLEGRTRTYFNKQVLQQAVISAIDLPILANNIIVDDDRSLSREWQFARPDREFEFPQTGS